MTTRLIDFATDADYQIHHLKGPTEFRTRHVRTGATSTTLVKGDYRRRAVRFPEGWVFVGGKPAATLASNTDAILTLYCEGRTKSRVFATWSVKKD